MAERASLYLFFTVLQFALTTCTTGTIMGYYYDARRDIATESYDKEAIAFMKLNTVSQSQTRVLVAEHEALKSYLNTNVNVDLFLNETQIDNLESKKSAVLWLKTQLLTSYSRVKIKSVVVSCNSRNSLLSTLKSIQSILHSLDLHNQVKVSVTLSLSFLENLDKTHERELHKIIEFIKKEKSYIFLENDNTEGELSGGDRYIQSFIKRATSILRYNDVSVVLVSKSLMKMKYQHTRKLTSVVEAPAITYPTTPITNPILPTVVTVPAANPVTITPSNPVTTPGTVPSTANPVNSPIPVINPITAPITVPGTQQPITNPVTTYPSPTGYVPVTTPVIPPVTNPPVVPGQTWCTAKNGALQNALQVALDYACGLGGADCSVIQIGASCYNPNTLQNHASYAFNSYYQKNPSPTSCDFGGTAMLVNVNPSSGSCIYPTSSSSLASTSTPSPPTTIPPPTPTATPTTIPPPTPTATPTIIPPSTPTTIPPYTPTPTTGAVPIYGSPPTVLNTSNPASPTSPVYGSNSPPDVNSSMSVSTGLRPFVGCIFLATSFITAKLILDM